MVLSMSNAADLPEQLRKWRNEAALTQRELARRAGCSPAMIANFEGGYIPQGGFTLLRVLKVLEDAGKDPDG